MVRIRREHDGMWRWEVHDGAMGRVGTGISSFRWLCKIHGKTYQKRYLKKKNYYSPWEEL